MLVDYVACHEARAVQECAAETGGMQIIVRN